MLIRRLFQKPRAMPGLGWNPTVENIYAFYLIICRLLRFCAVRLSLYKYVFQRVAHLKDRVGDQTLCIIFKKRLYYALTSYLFKSCCK